VKIDSYHVNRKDPYKYYNSFEIYAPMAMQRVYYLN